MTVVKAPSHFRRTVTDALQQGSTSPAAWFFATVWLLSALVLTVSGTGFPVTELLLGLVYLVFAVLIVGITEPMPTGTVLPGPARARVWWQLTLGLAFIALTAWSGLVFHHVVAEDAGIPGWTLLVEKLQHLGEQWLGEDRGNYLANPVTYTVIPLVVLLLAGARPAGLGFGRGHRVGRTLLLCCAAPFAWFLYAMLTGQLSPARLLGRIASNALQNGFFEEFLFRGVLQTRLRLLAGPGWAIVAQALVFGLWHLGLGYTNTGHAGLAPAIASTLVHQAVLGLLFGVLYERTRNLLAPSAVHVVLNSMG
jgi:membrane protease YdiL (CAAX protease family)